MLFVLLLLALLASARCIHLQKHRQLSAHKYYLGRHNQMHGYAFVHVLHNDTREPSRRRPYPRDVASLQKRQLRHACSAPIAAATRWKSSKGYVVHTRNRLGLSDDFVLGVFGEAFDRWQCVLDEHELTTIGPRVGVVRNSRASAIRLDRPTGTNEIGFGPIYGQPGTVAVTVVWGIFGGARADREISEFKMRFDENHYRFGNASLSRIYMDLQAVATHEAGHANGLDDIRHRGCELVTMFATSSEGEVNKRSLHEYDIDGLRDLYA